MSGTSAWNTGPMSWGPASSALDKEAMPSDAAEAARVKSAAIMEALKNGKPGEADRLMGKADTSASHGIIPVRHFAKKLFGRNKKDGVKEEKDEKEPKVVA